MGGLALLEIFMRVGVTRRGESAHAQRRVSADTINTDHIVIYLPTSFIPLSWIRRIGLELSTTMRWV